MGRTFGLAKYSARYAGCAPVNRSGIQKLNSLPEDLFPGIAEPFNNLTIQHQYPAVLIDNNRPGGQRIDNQSQ